jgi:hypothetical protein
MADAWLSGFSTALDVTIASMFPATDTIRGGLVVVVSAEDKILFDTTEDRTLLGLSLPAGYSSVLAPGGVVEPTNKGVLTSVSHVPGGSAAVDSPASYERFDIAIDFEVIASPSQAGGIIDVASFEFQIDASNFFRAAIRKGGGSDPNLPVAYGEVSTAPGEGLVTGNATLFADLTGKLTLRLVRNEDRVFAFVGRRDRTGRYTELTRVLDYKFFVGSGLGFVRFRTTDVASSVPAAVRWSNLTFRSHITIDGELVEDKVDFAQRRLVGKVPSTTVERRGLRDIFVFGLFGEAEAVNGFSYVLPSPKTVGQQFADSLRTYTDTQLRDLQTSVDLKDIDLEDSNG